LHIVAVKVGSGLKTYNVHKDLIAPHSPYFRAAFEEERFKEGQYGVLELPDANERIFRTVLDWLYAELASTFGGTRGELRNYSERFLTNNDLVQVYIFAGWYDMPQLRNSVCTEFHSYYHDWGLPMYAIVICAFESLPETSTLCRLLADVYASRFKRDHGDADEVAQHSRLPHSFLLQVMLRMSELRQPLGEEEDEEGHLSADGCQYHEHVSEVEKLACKKARGPEG